MTDRELLEAAARAAGIGDVDFDDCVSGYYPCQFDLESGDPKWWNPILDDGDALRLAVKLGLTVGPSHGATYATIAPCPDDFEDGNFPIRVAQMHNADPYAATRRAIVRAAADIGRAS